MPEYQMDKGGAVPPAYTWASLDAFTQGYIEALFWTSEAPGVTTEEWQATEEHDEGSIPGDVGFSDLAPEALQSILEDCQAFQDSPAYTAICEAEGNQELGDFTVRDEAAGHDFWLTRNGHGAGFWDGDWPEPHATALDEASKVMGEVDVCLGDDGKVYIS